MTLAKLNLLHLLTELYGRVHFSHSVYQEVVTAGLRQGYEDARTLYLFLNQMKWSPARIDRATIPSSLGETRLDRGERETLALAVNMGSPLVLIDEAEGRQAARSHGLTVRGSLGILIEAYRKDLVGENQLRLAVAEIVRRQDIWISPALAERVLREVLDQ
jgi:predicted nucleic acid-binding protein